MLLLALAKLSIERPGWYWTLGELAAKFSTAPPRDDGRALFEEFRAIHRPGVSYRAHLDVCPQCRENPLNLCATGEQLLRAAVDLSDRP